MKFLFEHVLRKYREKSGVTQEMMVDLLSHSSSRLKKLDNVTFSRWERGITVPPFKKQMEVYKLLGVDPIEEIINSNIELTNSDGGGVYYINDYYTRYVNEFSIYKVNRSNKKNVKLLIGDIELIRENDKFFDNICNIFNINECCDCIDVLINKLNAELIFCKYKNRLIAHSIMIYVSSSYIRDTISNSLSVSNLVKYKGSDKFVISFNSSTDKTLRFILGRIFNKYLDIPSIDAKLIMASSDKNILKLFNKLNAKVKSSYIVDDNVYKISEFTKNDINNSKEALHFIVDFRRSGHDKSN
ncbi:helix-turn-helix domain-containing protein [Aliivibrio fischeri]|uniref:helix-turn-helix domain-containing protein n=1 Tax=Aliivibrio fischeri TaxID=668 RepID=UPI00084C57CF|nr:helix-turn-helix transcriptional regulator [Aliivibrio fischeri]OED58163.1 transcriptional regulator [Aliivibrio fischeri]